MTHHQFGTVVGDKDTGGIFELGQAILMEEYSTVAIKTITNDEFNPLPVIAIEISGRINKSQDTFTAVFMIPILTAGGLSRALYQAVERIDDEQAMQDFIIGLKGGDELDVKGR